MQFIIFIYDFYGKHLIFLKSCYIIYVNREENIFILIYRSILL
ncbi:hypothetical protein HMPREF7545_1469 [Selenomonas noxia ATCC 43541]|nr:hypothetical protein HMPREF7545_1469 [Selenomonas noxia ATCC 43541]